MSHFYVACDLGTESGRVVLGNLHKEELTMSEVRRFPNPPIQEKGSVYWNIPQLYHEVLEALRAVGSYEEPVSSISCNSWAADYLLFESDGALITPTYHYSDPRTEEGMKWVLKKVPWEAVYEETGIRQKPGNTLFQLGAESSRRLRRAHHLLPVADGFNFLLSGVPRIEMSLASTTQLYNPLTQTWSERLLQTLNLRPELLPPLVSAGTELGPLRPELAKDTGLQDTRIVTSCSHEIAAALAGLPVSNGMNWAFLRPGKTTLLGLQLAKPAISAASRELNLTNEMGYDGTICLHKHTPGLSILEECMRSWAETDRGLDGDLLSHLAGSATPFESLINPTDPRFLTPGEMPSKIQEFCKETKQPMPRKPGPIFRCILESLALFYRKLFREIESLAGSEIKQLYILDGQSNSLLNRFTANVLQIPAVVVSADAAAIGNVVVQAVAQGHIKSIEQAREIVGRSFKLETITPHAGQWEPAYERFVALFPA